MQSTPLSQQWHIDDGGNLHKAAAAVVAVAARELQQPPTRRLQFGLVWLRRARGKELRSLQQEDSFRRLVCFYCLTGPP